MRPQIMYIENKNEGLNGRGRIGRATFSKTGRSIYYGGKTFQSLKGAGFKANYFDVATGEQYWISRPKKGGGDRLYGTPGALIDEDVRTEYWQTIRKQPSRVREPVA